MAFARWNRPVQDEAGNLITDIWCEVRREDVAGNPKATLYSDREGAVPLSNPFLAENGVPSFHAAGGAYRVRVYKAGHDETFRYQAVGTGAEIDADSLLIPGYLFEFETSTSAPPGEGGIRANNADLSAATRLYIDKETVAAIDISARIEALADRRVLLTSTNAGEQVSWSVGLVSDEGDYYELVLSVHSGATEIVAGRCGLQREGTQGPAGIAGLFTGEEVVLTGTSETLVTAYRGQTIILDSATPMALAAQAAATLGDDWAVIVKNVGAGTATLDPDGAETVDGAATLAIPQDMSLMLFSNGTALRSQLVSHAIQPLNKGGTGKATAPAAIEALAAQSLVGHSNLALVASVNSNALTVAVKGIDGNDPSANNPVSMAFRNATANVGTPTLRTLTSALSITVPNGGTMGFANNTPGRLWVVAFDDGGTVRLGLINCLSGTSIYPLRSHRFATSAQVGTGSDNAHAFYTNGAGVAAKAYLVLGYLDWASGLSTAGAWASAPTLVQVQLPGLPLPGDVLQTVRADVVAVATGSTQLPFDDSVPQQTEGDEYMTLAVAARAEVNLLSVSAQAMVALTSSTFVTMALFKGSASNAIAAIADRPGNTDSPLIMTLRHVGRAASVSSETFKIRVGRNSSATVTLNGTSGSRMLGGVANSYLEISELMA